MYNTIQYQQQQNRQQQQQQQQLPLLLNPLGVTKTINLNSIHNHQRQQWSTNNDEDNSPVTNTIQAAAAIMGDIGEIEKLQVIRSAQAGLQTPEYKPATLDDHQHQSDQQQEIEDQNIESSNNSPTDSINHNNNNNDDANSNNNNQETETYADANGDNPTQSMSVGGDVSVTGGGGGGDLMNDTTAMSSQMVSMRDQTNDSIDTMAHNSSQQVIGFTLKPDGKSAKYPELKQYYNFGTWVGRNRKAICIRCNHTAASSQPLRLIKHLRKCTKLSDEEKLEVEDLLVYHQNKDKWVSKKGSGNMSLSEGDDSDIWGTESPIKSATTNNAATGAANTSSSSNFHLPAPAKRVKREHPEWKATVDQALIRWIVHNRVPLKTIHSKEFLDFARLLDPEYHMPSRETITNVLIPRALNII